MRITEATLLMGITQDEAVLGDDHVDFYKLLLGWSL